MYYSEEFLNRYTNKIHLQNRYAKYIFKIDLKKGEYISTFNNQQSIVWCSLAAFMPRKNKWDKDGY